jgi:NADH:ubiquinone oxidoreductase subunit D
MERASLGGGLGVGIPRVAQLLGNICKQMARIRAGSLVLAEGWTKPGAMTIFDYQLQG